MPRTVPLHAIARSHTSYHPPGDPASASIPILPRLHRAANYDSLIGKVIAYGENRDQAIRRMRIALSEMAIEGIQTNIALHQELLLDNRVIKGGVNIHYSSRNSPSKRSAIP